MPVKRRLAKGREHKITEEAISAWLLANEILESGGEEEWEESGGRRREYLDASSALDRALGLKPWEDSPLDVPERGSLQEWWPWCKNPNELQLGSWHQAQQLRRNLIRAAKR